MSQHNNRALSKSTEALSLLMESVLEEAKRQGASDAAVSVGHDTGFSVDVRMGEVETLAFSEEKGVSITVYLGTQKGHASSSDTSCEAVSTMVRAALDIARVSAADPCAGLPDKESVVFDYPDLDLYHPSDMTPALAIEKAQACEKVALDYDKRIVNSDGVSVSTYAFISGYATTQGFLGIVPSTRHTLSASMIAKEGENMQRDYEYSVSRYPEKLHSIEHVAHTASMRALERLGARSIPTQECPVILSSRISSGLFSTFIQAISGGNLYRKNSFLLDGIGKVIFPEWMQIYEQPHLIGALGSTPFDSEGLMTRPNILVQNGVLNQYVLSTYTGRKLGLKTTANAGGVSNLTIESTGKNLDALLKTMGRGLLVTELMGQGINLLTGDYSRGAAGFWVEDGQIQYPVEEVTIAGNLEQMFRHIQEVGQDLNPNVATRCGSVLISSMMVAGKS